MYGLDIVSPDQHFYERLKPQTASITSLKRRGEVREGNIRTGR